MSLLLNVSRVHGSLGRGYNFIMTVRAGVIQPTHWTGGGIASLSIVRASRSFRAAPATPFEKKRTAAKSDQRRRRREKKRRKKTFQNSPSAYLKDTTSFAITLAIQSHRRHEGLVWAADNACRGNKRCALQPKKATKGAQLNEANDARDAAAPQPQLVQNTVSRAAALQ